MASCSSYLSCGQDNGCQLRSVPPLRQECECERLDKHTGEKRESLGVIGSARLYVTGQGFLLELGTHKGEVNTWNIHWHLQLFQYAHWSLWSASSRHPKVRPHFVEVHRSTSHGNTGLLGWVWWNYRIFEEFSFFTAWAFSQLLIFTTKEQSNDHFRLFSPRGMDFTFWNIEFEFIFRVSLLGNISLLIDTRIYCTERILLQKHLI